MPDSTAHLAPAARFGADIPVTLSSSSVFPLGTQDVFATAEDLGYVDGDPFAETVDEVNASNCYAALGRKP